MCCIGSASGCSQVSCSPICSPTWAPLGAADDVAEVMVLQRSRCSRIGRRRSWFCLTPGGSTPRVALDFDCPGRQQRFGAAVVHGSAVQHIRLAPRIGRSKSSRRCWRSAKSAGPLYHAVATMDPVTLIRWAIRACRKSLTRELAAELQDQVSRDDDYTAAGKPLCDDEDPGARAALVALARLDAFGLRRANRPRVAGLCPHDHKMPAAQPISKRPVMGSSQRTRSADRSRHKLSQAETSLHSNRKAAPPTPTSPSDTSHRGRRRCRLQRRSRSPGVSTHSTTQKRSTVGNPATKPPLRGPRSYGSSDA